MHRFLRGLVVFGICREEPDGRFGITELGTWLQETKPRSVRGQAVRCGEYITSWGSLLHSVMTGETAFRHVYGDDVWNYRSRNPVLDESFNRAFQITAVRIAREFLAVYDLSSVLTIADIGGGYGALLAAILKDTPSVTGLLFDQPHVVAKASPYLREAGVFQRCRIHAGDFFSGLPDGADLYILKSVIHDWDDSRSGHILMNCRRALKKKARLILIERIMPDRVKRDPHTVLLDLRMLAMTGGRERNESEFRALFEAAGLRLTRIIPLRSGFNVIEGVPA
jgi:SAM-dependent methyltransferase